MHRRDVILAGLSLLTGAHAFVPRRVQSQAQDPAARLLRALQANRMPPTMTGRPAGPGWDWLVQQARDATFTLIGEQAGVAESAQLAAALFATLRASGYARIAVGLSPAIAHDMEAAARRSGMPGIADLLRTPSVWTFYNLREEAQFVTDVIAAAPRNERVCGDTIARFSAIAI